MSDPDLPGDGDNPFAGLPLFGDLGKLLGQQGPLAWDAARQLAYTIAAEGGTDANVDPLDRISFEQLARVAELHVTGATGLTTSRTGRAVELTPVTRVAWTQLALDDLRPLFERLAGALRPPTTPPSIHPSTGGPDAGLEGLGGMGDPEAGWLGGMLQMLQPMMLGMTAGSLVGNLATRSFGLYDLPIPRPARDVIPVLVGNLDGFGQEWSLDRDDLRLWLCVHELTHHAVLGCDHIRARLESLLDRWAAGFDPDPDAIERRLGQLDPTVGDPMTAMQQLLGDPEVLLGAARSPAQEQLAPQLDTILAVISGYVDHTMDRIGTNLIASYPRVTEAMRRRRVEAAQADRFVERLFGFELTQERFDQGAAFVAGVIERAGESGLDPLLRSERALPTPAELAAPGLWLARLEIDEPPAAASEAGDEPSPA